MQTKLYSGCLGILVVSLLMSTDAFSQTGIGGPAMVCPGSAGNVYAAPSGLSAYNWVLSGGGTFTAGENTGRVTVTWNEPGTWTLSVSDGSVPVDLNVTVKDFPLAPAISGPVNPQTEMPATLKNGATPGQVYTTDTGMSNYVWSVSSAGTIKSGQGTSALTVDWLAVSSQQTLSVTYTNTEGCPASSVMLIQYFPFAEAFQPDPLTTPKFVDPLPHFAAGLRINAKNGGNLTIKTVPVKQVALSTGTVLANGTVGTTPGAGLGNYAAYSISRDGGNTWGIPMWPAQTIEAKQGKQLTIQYVNGLAGLTYNNFNILADQTLMMKGYDLTGNPLTDPYLGEIPMVVHLHGGEIPSNSDGGPNSWFMPSGKLGPAFQFNSSSLVTYPNMQEATTLWYHPHDDGLTRINVYTGLAGFYFLRGADEETAMLPGWSQDDMVRENTPTGIRPDGLAYTPTFNGATPYLPEIEIAIQDRMFDINGALYWPVDPPNPEIHPFWTPEFIGNVMTVNGKAWPYLSVAPRKYRFRFLDGCHARWLDLWLVNAADGAPGPAITVIGGEGGLLSTPAVLDPALGKTMLFGPGQRYDVIIDFTGIPAGTAFTLMNKAGAPYPDGDPVIPGLTDRIMQFIVSGEMVSALDPLVPGTDKSLLPANLRPVAPLVQLTDFNGNLAPGVVPEVKRQIILNEVMGGGGPASVLINNTYFDTELSFSEDPRYRAGGPTEFMREGTTEIVEIANVSADAHPIHIHLAQWQLVSRQPIDADAYLTAYMDAWQTKGIPEFPSGMGYPGGGGTPLEYDAVNDDKAVGGNPAFSNFLIGAPIPANPEEMGWKDNVTVLPGQVTTFVVRLAPTDLPVTATADQLLYPFDPSLGPGYVWHCHVIDHEDMSMMRPLMILPSVVRLPMISAQPVPKIACTGDAPVYSVTATSLTPLTYQWQVSTDEGKTWTNLADGAPYAGCLTPSLSISSAVTGLSGNSYRCVLTNTSGKVESDAASLIVNDCFIGGTLKYNNSTNDPLAGFTISVNGKTAITDASGEFSIPGVISGIFPVLITPPAGMLPGSINSTDAGRVNGWALAPVAIENVRYLAGDVNNDLLVAAGDANAIQRYFVSARLFQKGPWAFAPAGGTGIANPPALSVTVNGAPVTGFDLLGMFTGDFNGSFSTGGPGISEVSLIPGGNVMPVPAGKSFDIPLRLTDGGTIGAVSLVLNVPSELVSLNNVKIPGSTGAVDMDFTGSILKIGWNSTKPVNVPAGGNLVILSVNPTKNFTSGALKITMLPDASNELADATFQPVQGAQLTVDEVRIAALKLSTAPNPASNLTTVTYEVPEGGIVSLGIYTRQGVLLRPLLTSIPVAAGSYTIDVDVSALTAGTYYLTMTFNNGFKTTKITTQLIKQ